MSEEVPQLLRDMLKVLRGIYRQQRRAENVREQLLDGLEERTSYLQENLPGRESWMDDHEQRMQEIQAEADRQRLEEKEFRDNVLLELKRQSQLLNRLIDRLDAIRSGNQP